MNPNDKTNNQSRFAVVRNILFVVFLLIFLVSTAFLIWNIAERHKGNKLYRDLKDTFFSAGLEGENFDVSAGGVSPLEADGGYSADLSITDRLNGEQSTEDESVKVGKEYNETLLKVRAGLNSLRQINEDIYGWIHVDNSGISYPIVQSEDNEFYLDHAYNGDFSPLGAIFADFRCAGKITDNYNTVLYGHNLLTGGEDMFHDIEMFFDTEFFDTAYIYIYTFDGIYVYEPFSVYEARYDYNYYRVEFESDGELVAFAEQVKEHSRCENSISFEAGDRIITLSTCTNNEYYTRYALHAKLINVIED